VSTIQKINMTYITSEEIGLEDVEKKRGLVSFQSTYETPVLKVEEIQPVLKKKPAEITIRDGNKHRNRKQSNLF
jgi:hypothetical protein